jgi:hypothetical protein
MIVRTAPRSRQGSRGRPVFIAFLVILVLVVGGAFSRPAAAFLTGGITMTSGVEAARLVDAAQGSLINAPRGPVNTIELGLLAGGPRTMFGPFVSRTAFYTGIGQFRMHVVGGSLVQSTGVAGAIFGVRTGMGLASGSFAQRGGIFVWETVLGIPVPGAPGLLVTAVSQVLVPGHPTSASGGLFHVARIGITARVGARPAAGGRAAR